METSLQVKEGDRRKGALTAVANYHIIIPKGLDGMGRNIWLLLVFAVVLVGAYLCQTYWSAAKPEKPHAPAVQVESVEPKPAPQAKQEPVKTAPANRTEKMELSPASRGFTPSPEASATFSCSQQKPPERQILPGVSIASGGGVNIKTGAEAETIRLRRDDAGSYQVLWQKKY